MQTPCPLVADGEELVLRDDFLEILKVSDARHAKFRVRGAVAALEAHVDVASRFRIVERVAAVSHAEDGGSHDERAVAVQVVAEFVEQAQREGLIGHQRPVVEQLVAAAVEHDAGVAAERMQDGASLLLEHLKVVRRALVIVAGEREFRPDHDAEAVAQVVEGCFVNAGTAPAAQDVHVRIAGEGEQRLVALFIHMAVVNIGIDPVAALCKDRTAVELQLNGRDAAALGEGDGLNPAALVHDQTDAADAEVAANFMVCRAGDIAVERLLALTVAPPKARVGDGKVAARAEAHSLGVKQLDCDRGVAVRFKADVRARKVVIEGVERLAARDVIRRPGFHVGVLPDAGDEHARMPVPCVADRGLDALIRLLAILKFCAFALGVGVDTDDQLAARLAVKGNFHPGKHPLMLADNLPVKQDIKPVIHALGDENSLLLGLCIVLEHGSVFPGVPFGDAELFDVIAEVDVAPAHHQAVVVLNIARNLRLKPEGRAVFADRARLPVLEVFHHNTPLITLSDGSNYEMRVKSMYKTCINQLFLVYHRE